MNASLKATTWRVVAGLCALAMAAAFQVLAPDAAAARVDDGAGPPVRLPLLHLENARGVPLYTLSRAEADNAVAKHGFTLKPNRHGSMWTRDSLSSTTAVHRLTKIGGNGWVLISSPTELGQVLGTNRFEYEGIVGYVSNKKVPGTVRLSRYSKPNGVWRVSLPAPYGNPNALTDNGYRLDGPLGYVDPN